MTNTEAIKLFNEVNAKVRISNRPGELDSWKRDPHGYFGHLWCSKQNLLKVGELVVSMIRIDGKTDEYLVTDVFIVTEDNGTLNGVRYEKKSLYEEFKDLIGKVTVKWNNPCPRRTIHRFAHPGIGNAMTFV